MVGNELIYSIGYHRIENLGDGRSDGEGQIKNFLIGEVFCSRIDLIEDDISKNSYEHISCRAYKYQEAGEYDFTEKVDVGYAEKSIRTMQTSFFTEKDYEVRIAPKILSMSAHSGG